MKQFEEWFDKYPYANFDCIETARVSFKAGMSEAADMCKKRADKYIDYDEKEKAVLLYDMQAMINGVFLEDD